LFIVGCRETSKRFGEGPVDLTKWKAINYSYPANKQPTANWVISGDKLSVTQEVNADPSSFLSDRNLLDTSISGTWFVNSSSDGDFMCIVVVLHKIQKNNKITSNFFPGLCQVLNIIETLRT
jgi:hypothetical protein